MTVNLMTKTATKELMDREHIQSGYAEQKDASLPGWDRAGLLEILSHYSERYTI